MLHEESGIISCFQSSLYLYMKIIIHYLVPIDNVRMISMMIRYVRRITLTCNTAALVPRAVCSSCAVLCNSEKICVPSRSGVKTKMYRPCRRKKKYRPFLSWKKSYTVPSRREKLYALSRPVEQKVYTVPSRRDNIYLPSCPIVTIFTYRAVPS